MTQERERSGYSDEAPARPESIEASGRTVDEAIERALSSLGAQRSQVDVVVLDEGSRGVLGIGAREARVRLSRRSGGAEIVGAVARDLLGFMGISAGVSVEERPEGIRVNVEGANVGGLIGKHGQTLEAVEALLVLLVGRKAGGPVRIELDAEGYRERREASLQDLAKRTADRVARTGREVALTPMSPRDRRIIHVALQDHPRVGTVSRGEHAMRRVVVMPKGGRGAREGREGVRDEDHVEALEREPEGQPADPGSQSELPTGSGNRRADRVAGSGRSRYQRPRTGEGRASQRPARFGRPERAHGRRSEVPGKGSAKGSRPEGLPVEEEIEAEIEAYLARTSGEKKTDQNPQEPPEEPTQDK